MTIVVNIRVTRKFDVYIGRPSPWGNPFKIGRDAGGTFWSRDDVIRLYDAWIQQEIAEGRLDVRELRDRVLGCYCHPLPCHGDVLARLADALV